MLISIYDGRQQLETRECRIVSLPDGRQGAVWRGLAYPVLSPDARINVGDQAFLPSTCGTGEASDVTSPFAVIEGDEEAYLLLSGPAASCETAAGALKAAGYDVLRTGRYLGDSVAGVEADWFVRFLKPGQFQGSLELTLKQALQASVASAASHDAASSDFRTRLLLSELSAARAREAGLHTEIAKLKVAAAGVDAKVESDALRIALEQERELKEAAEAAAQELASHRSAVPLHTLAPPKLKDEIETVIATLLRRVRLIRDSLTVISTEFANRRTIYRTFQELHETREGRPANWKKVQGIDGWWERHVSNGQDDSGRAYARWSSTERYWEVLVSHKGEQARDIVWLRRR